jgi:hypothetical protein
MSFRRERSASACVRRGLGGFYTPTGVGTLLATGKECRDIDGRTYLFERPLFADVALFCGERGDAFGNLTYHLVARNFGPVMAAAARLAIAEVRSIVPVGALDPEEVVTPGIFLDRIVETARLSAFRGKLWRAVPRTMSTSALGSRRWWRTSCWRAGKSFTIARKASWVSDRRHQITKPTWSCQRRQRAGDVDYGGIDLRSHEVVYDGARRTHRRCLTRRISSRRKRRSR